MYLPQKTFSSFLLTTKSWLLKHIKLQILICSVSLPILIYNGLPISLMSLFSTLLFVPLLTIYLFLSSFIFFFELLFLPNEWIIWLLEQVTSFWHSLLTLSNNQWLFGFALPPIGFLLLLPVVAFLILHTKSNIKYIASFFCLFFVATFSTFRTLQQSHIVQKISCNQGEVTLIKQNKTIIIDPGFIARRPSAASWVRFTLAPEIIKQTGTLRIDHFIALQLSARLFDVLLQLNAEIPIKHLYLPFWDGLLPRNAWFAYIKLRDALKTQGSNITSIKSTPFAVTLSDQIRVTIEPLESILRYTTCTYPSLHVHGQIDNTPISIYAAKNKKKDSY